MNNIDNGKIRLRKFHVGTGQTDQEIIDQFVVRHNELETVLEVLESNIGAESCQHQLIVAPRGRGKSTLLVRVIAELNTSPHLSQHLMPIRLMEESQEIFTLADFWLESLYYLAKSCSGINQALADELIASHATLTENWADTNLESRARAAVLDAADRLQRRLVIMIENLQSLCVDADKNFGWDLRQVLQSEPQVILLATATSHFAALQNAKDPFFELFRILCLPPLDTAECCRLWQAVSGESVEERSIKPLQILTGGSPRLMVVLASFTRDRSLRQLMEQLVELIDDHTEYFRGHIEELASKERRVYIAVIDLWQASTAAEIATRARMEIRTVSSLLGRLVTRGALVIDDTGSKRTYFASERLYSIYYKLRRDRDEATVVRNLIHFMATYYHGDGLVDLSRRLVQEASESNGIRQGLIRAATEMPELKNLVEGHGMLLPVSTTSKGAESLLIDLGEIEQKLNVGEYDTAINLVDNFIQEDLSVGGKISQESIAKAIFLKGLVQALKGDTAAAIESYDLVVSRFSESKEPGLQVEVASALLEKGAILGYQGKREEEIKTYGSLVLCFGESEASEMQVQIAKALINKAVALGLEGSWDAAIVSYESVVSRFSESKEPGLQVEVARSLFNKGVILGYQGKREEEIKTYGSLVSCFGESEAPEMQVQIVKALVNKAIILGQQGKEEDEIKTYDSIVSRFSDSRDMELMAPIARALYNKAVALGRQDNRVGEIETYDLMVSRFSEGEVPELQIEIGRALVNKMYVLAEQGNWAEIIETGEEVVLRFSDNEAPEFQVYVAKALFNKAYALEKQGNSAASIENYDLVVSRFSDGEVLELQVQTISALMNKAVSLMEQGKWVDATETFLLVVSRFEDSKHLELMVQVAKALSNAVQLFCFSGEADAALRKVKELREHAKKHEELEPYKLSADWVEAMARILTGEIEIVEKLFKDIYSRFDPNDETLLGKFQFFVPTLVALGAAPEILVQILEQQKDKYELLKPLAVALRLEAGEKVRAPAELLEVAADIRDAIEQKRKELAKRRQDKG